MSKNIEIEIKVRLQDSAPLLTFVNEHGQKGVQGYQKDEYFTPKHRNFLKTVPIKEWLRVRTEHGRSSLNYKNWQYQDDGKAYGCDEYGTLVSNEEGVRAILQALNFESLVVVEKKRTTYTYDQYEIALDSVANLGDFVEIEYKGNVDVDPRLESAKMIKFLNDIGCTILEQDFKGYPFQLLDLNKRKENVVN